MVPSTQLQNSYNFLIDIEQRYKNDMNLREAEDIKKILRRHGKNTQKNCTKKVLMTWITTMVWSLT